MSPKTIATINFKGGVGKTTVTWCLGQILSSTQNGFTLMFDLDAQMSLTQAIALNEDKGFLEDRFHEWYRTATGRRKTIFNALKAFTRSAQHFNFDVGFDFVYKITETFHFVPSVKDLYWLELDVIDREQVRDFIPCLLRAITNSNRLPSYDFVLFDCPPSFTLLSYSVLSCCDLVLIPVNPDFFASKGVRLLLEFLPRCIEQHPLPKIGIFMNKAKTRGNALTREVQFYRREVERAYREVARTYRIDARFFSSYIPERVSIGRAIKEGEVPAEVVDDFESLWGECIQFLG